MGRSGGQRSPKWWRSRLSSSRGTFSASLADEKKKTRTGAEDESGDVGCAAVTTIRRRQRTTPWALKRSADKSDTERAVQMQALTNFRNPTPHPLLLARCKQLHNELRSTSKEQQCGARSYRNRRRHANAARAQHLRKLRAKHMRGKWCVCACVFRLREPVRQPPGLRMGLSARVERAS